jgi:hypothetical protein
MQDALFLYSPFPFLRSLRQVEEQDFGWFA